jgi:hypothetical protein
MGNSTLKTFVINSQAVRYTLLFLLFFTSNAVFAQHFHSTSPYLQGTQVQAEQYYGPSAAMYQSTIYEPFTAASPSSNNNNAPAGISGRRNIDENDFGFEDESNKSNESPAGEPWIMLLFAAIGAGVIFIKQRKKLKAKA